MISEASGSRGSGMYAKGWRVAAEQPSGILGKLRGAVRHLAISTSALFSDKECGSFLRCITCHYVFDDQVSHFETLIQRLCGIGKFVNTDTCASMLRGETPIDGRYFHLSFDDGFRNVITNGFPILRKFGVPAILFVPTDLVGANWERTSHYCIEVTKYRAVVELAGWEDLAAIDHTLFEVGSHTKTHIRASVVSKNVDALRAELTDSRREIEQKLGKECKYLAWPFGKRSDVDDLSRVLAQEAGYHAAFSVERGAVQPGRSSVFFLPRHHFEPQWPLSHILYFARGNMEKTQGVEAD